MKNGSHSLSKPVIFLMIDSLMSHPLEMAIQTGHAPALEFLMEQGNYFPKMVSSFPTMSVTIDSSILTGTYTDQHKIPGLNWFDINQKRMINYGTGLRETTNSGLHKVISDMFYRLNNEHLSKNVTTIYEELAELGIPSASINSFVYRGNTLKDLNVPHLISAYTVLKGQKKKIKAPSTLSLGVFSKLRRFSFPTEIVAGNFRYTARELRHLIRKKELPGFTMCIFQDLDFRIHFKGPTDIKGISKIDRQIQKILNLYPSWEEGLNQNIWMVMGDNGHAPMGSKYSSFIIDLRKVLTNFNVAKIDRPIKDQDDLFVCVNQRMAYIYLLKNILPIETLVKQLKGDSRIDVIAWKDQRSIHVVSGIRDGIFSYSKGGNQLDIYNQAWAIEGDLEVLDLKITLDNKIDYGDYPDALARLYGALHSHEGQFIVVNAKPGCEFKSHSTPFHLGGACHGSLHKQESLVPLIVAGTEAIPEYPRFIDIKDFILDILKDQTNNPELN